MEFNSFVFKVNGVTIKTPTSFDIEFQPISDGERLLNGDMQLEGVADKHVVILRYDFITKEELSAILGETWTKFRTNRTKLKQSITFPYFDDDPITLNTYFAPMRISRTSVSTKNGGWENFELKFIEL